MNKKTKDLVYTDKKWLKIEDSSSLILSDLGTLLMHRMDIMDLLSFIGKRLTASEESFVDVWVGEESNALAFDLGNVKGLFVTTLTDQNRNVLEIKITPEKR